MSTKFLLLAILFLKGRSKILLVRISLIKINYLKFLDKKSEEIRLFCVGNEEEPFEERITYVFSSFIELCH